MYRIFLGVYCLCFFIIGCSKEDSRPKEVSLEKISLNQERVELKSADSFQLTLTFTPENAFNKEVIWSTNDTNVASVSETGLVRAHNIGQASITARNPKYNITATITVEVSPVNMAKISLSKNSLQLLIGSFEALTAVILPENTTNKSLKWTSEDPSIATVNENGRVDAINAGSTIITVKNEEGDLSEKVTVNVLPIQISALTLNKNSFTLEVDETEILMASFEPTNATDVELIWSSSDTKIATVDQKGIIKAISEGFVNVIVKTNDGKVSQTAKITVKSVSTTAITLNKTILTLLAEDASVLIPNIHPSNAANKNITWKSSDRNIVTVDKNGSIIAHEIGTAIITATTIDGSFEAECIVNVVSPDEVIQIVAKPNTMSTRDVPGNNGVNIPLTVGVYNPTYIPIKVKTIKLLINGNPIVSYNISTPAYTKTYYYYDLGTFFFPFPIVAMTLLDNWIVHTEYEIKGITYLTETRFKRGYGPLTWIDFDETIYGSLEKTKIQIQRLNLSKSKPIEIKSK